MIDFAQDDRPTMTEGHRERSFNGGTAAPATRVNGGALVCTRLSRLPPPSNSRTPLPAARRQRKRYTALCIPCAATTEVLRDICRRRTPNIADAYWLKDIPAAFDDSGVVRSCLSPIQPFHVDDFAK